MPTINDIKVCVISTRRPENVKYMETVVLNGQKPTWFVGHDEFDVYSKSGAGEDRVIESGGLVEARNAALDHSWNDDKVCVMIDDDVSGFYQAIDKKRKKHITFVQAINIIQEGLKETRNMFYFAGSAPTDNTFYYNPDKPMSFKNFIGGWFMYIRPCELHFDPQLRMKEDYDYTLQHIQRYGGVCRRNDILLDVKHYGNKGGVVDYRNDELEQDSIRKLKAKWGNRHVVDNPRRKNEILMKV